MGSEVKPMRRMHRSDCHGGFTLIELIISIAVATLVTAAATTVLLLALRVNRQSSQTATKQYTVRTLLSAMENAASNGDIESLSSKSDGWELKGGDRAIFSYESQNQTISVNGAAVLEGVYASHATLNNDLLTVFIENSEGVFTSAVYCRTIVNFNETLPTVPTQGATENDLSKFLSALASQYGSTGRIKDGDTLGQYYSEWYIDGYVNNPGWNAETPWCACFVSWALNKAGITAQGREKWFAEVDEFMAYFQTAGRWYESAAQVGDLVFFDWIRDDVQDAQHVGVVIGVADNAIYTIEGNSAGRVAMRSYPKDDWRILGYGRLDFTV